MVKNLQFEDGKMIAAAQYFSAGSSVAVELNEEEKNFAENMRVGIPIWHFVSKASICHLKCCVFTGSVAEYSY